MQEPGSPPAVLPGSFPLDLGTCQLEALVATCDDAVAVLDLGGTVTAWNEAAADLCGYSVAEALGASLASLVVPAELMHERSELLGAVASGASLERRAVRRRKDGTRLLLSLRMSPVRDEAGAVVGSVWVAKDVSERRDREREQRTSACARRWERRIDEALAEDGLVFAAQPLVDLRRGEVDRFELLMRMRRRDRLLGPGEFLPFAERSGQIRELDRWAVHRGIALARRFPVALNVSGVSISDPRLFAEIRRAFEREGTAPARVTFEITETAAARDVDGAALLIGRLRELGCGVALDDFGTGFGSLTYLHRLPVNELKIDREFIGPDAAAMDRRVVETVLATARIFEMRTVAEGVEDAGVLRRLEEHGVDLAQGYLLGRPTPVEDAMTLPRRILAPRPAAGDPYPASTGDELRGRRGEASWPVHIRDLASTRSAEARELRARARESRRQARLRRSERRQQAAIRIAERG